MPARTKFVMAASLLAAALLFGPPTLAQEDPGCTLTQGFWKTHPEAWPVEMMIVGGDPYTKDQLIGLLKTPPRGDATYILAKQLIAAQLNVMSGADSAVLGTLLADAEAWLTEQGLGSWPRGEARAAGTDMARQLDEFNNGLSGVPHCEDGPGPSPTPPPEEPQD